MDALLQQRDSIAAAVSEANEEVGTVFAQDKPSGLDLLQWQSRQSLAAARQSPQPKPRTASFSDDGCVAPTSISNSVAAPMSETSPAGRHPISDGGALYPQLPEKPQPIGRFSDDTAFVSYYRVDC